jgi:hypothetical protein
MLIFKIRFLQKNVQNNFINCFNRKQSKKLVFIFLALLIHLNEKKNDRAFKIFTFCSIFCPKICLSSCPLANVALTKPAMSADGTRGGRMGQSLMQLGSSAVNHRGGHPSHQMLRHGKGGGGVAGLEAALLQAARHQHGAQGKGGSVRRLSVWPGRIHLVRHFAF